MNSTILQTIKDLLGLDNSYEAFDNELIPHINGVLFTLYQIGVTDSPFVIATRNETWGDLLGSDESKLELVKNYMFWKTKLAFDPPSSGILMDAIKAQIAESEWRIFIETDNALPEDEDKDDEILH